MKTLTLATIYEKQGFVSEALEIYREISQREPENKEAIVGLQRLKRIKIKFDGENTKMRDFFVQMQTKEQFLEFKKWLWN